MQLFLEDKPIILRLLEDTYYSQIIPRIICQSLSMMQCMYDAWLCHEFCALCNLTL